MWTFVPFRFFSRKKHYQTSLLISWMICFSFLWIVIFSKMSQAGTKLSWNCRNAKTLIRFISRFFGKLFLLKVTPTKHLKIIPKEHEATRKLLANFTFHCAFSVMCNVFYPSKKAIKISFDSKADSSIHKNEGKLIETFEIEGTFFVDFLGSFLWTENFRTAFKNHFILKIYFLIISVKVK